MSKKRGQIFVAAYFVYSVTKLCYVAIFTALKTNGIKTHFLQKISIKRLSFGSIRIVTRIMFIPLDRFSCFNEKTAYKSL